MIDAKSLAHQLELDPRCIILSGHLEERSKQDGKITGTTPHYAAKGNAVIPFGADGNPTYLEPMNAEVEINLREARDAASALPIGDVFFFNGAKASGLLQVMVGRNGDKPTIPEARMLRETGNILADLANRRVQVHVVALPILTSGMGGVIMGRYLPLGIFDMASGATIWLFPRALGHLKGITFPDYQKERYIDAPAAAKSASGKPTWYAEQEMALGEFLKGAQLRDRILQTRAKFLFQEGHVPSLEEGMKVALADLGEAGPAPASTAAPATAAPKKPSASRTLVAGQKK